MQITRDMFNQQLHPRFGTANPERMRLALWEWLIRGKVNGQSRYARDLFNEPVSRDNGPIWTFGRDGATQTELPDGRTVCVGGEYEDFYDPDFCIYNDVVVLGPDDNVEIYGYPKQVFPPTDFHTATLIDGRIIIIGSLGYREDRRAGQTPVYALNLERYAITPVETTGPAPGWLSNHEAALGANGTIIVKGGEVIENREGKLHRKQSLDEYSLDPSTGVWQRMTERQNRQFSIMGLGAETMPLMLRIGPAEFFPVEMPEAEIVSVSLFGDAEFRLNGRPVSVKVRVRNIDVVIQGSLPEHVVNEFVDAMRIKAEAVLQYPCVCTDV